MMRRPSLRQILPGAFWLGVVFEALATLLALLRIPPDPKHAILAGFSLSRLILLIGVAGVALFSVSMVFASRQSRVTRSWKALLFDDQRRTGWLLFAAVSIDSICAWLLLLPPPHFQGAIIERLRPILVLALLVTIQALAICLWADQRRITTAWTALWRGLSEFLDRPGVGAGLLAFSFGIGLATLYFTYYNMADEGDTITVGWLISQGQVLYRDIFSHHFPFAYLWVGAVFRLFGPSILAARLSVVVFRTALFAASMKLSRMFFPTGLIAVVWSLVGPLYLTNMLMYDTFGAILFCPAFLIGLAILRKKIAPSIARLLTVGGMLSLAILSDPSTAVPGCVLLAGLFLAGFRSGASWKERLRKAGHHAGMPLLAMGFVGVAYLAWLLATSSLGDFFKDALWFNQVVYNQYAPLPKFQDLIRPIIRGLDVLNPSWRVYTSPYYHWTSYVELDQWVFTGLFFRLAIIGLVISLWVKRERLAAGWVYLTACALLFRANAALHAQAFMLFSLTCAGVLVGNGLSSLNTQPDSEARPLNRLAGGWRKLAGIGGGVGIVAVGVAFVWLGMRGAQFWVDNRGELSYVHNFSGYEGNGGYYREMTCNQSDATLLIYPGKPIDYFFAQLRPAARYSIMYPWIADVGQSETVATLDRIKDRPVFVVLDENADVWGYPVKVYLRDLISFLDRVYFRTGEGTYISPGLKQRCDPQLNPQ